MNQKKEIPSAGEGREKMETHPTAEGWEKMGGLGGWEAYWDIIDLPRPVSTKHRPMSRKERAAQFAPFAALTGFEEEVQEAARQKEKEMEK